MILRIFLLCLLCVLLGLLGFFALRDSRKYEDLNVTRYSSLSQGEKLSFSLNLNDGSEFFIKADNNKLAFDSQQKAVLFVFFTTWCNPCVALTPHLNKLQEKYKDNFIIVGILLEDKSTSLNEFVQTYKINFPIAVGEGNYLLAKSVGGINALPVMLLYSSDGKLINHYLGIIPQEMLDIDIQKAIM